MATTTSRRVDAARFFLEKQSRGPCGLYVHRLISEEGWNDPTLDRAAYCEALKERATHWLPGTWRVDVWTTRPPDDHGVPAVVVRLDLVVRCALIDYDDAMAEAHRIVDAAASVDPSVPNG